MPVPKSKAEKLVREQTAFEMKVKGHTFEQIAAVLGISRQGAKDAHDRVLATRQTKLDDLAAEVKERQILELALVRSEAWAGWDRSQMPEEKTRETEKAIAQKVADKDKKPADSKATAPAPAVDPVDAEPVGLYLDAETGDETTSEERAHKFAQAAFEEATKVAQAEADKTGKPVDILTVFERVKTKDLKGQSGDPAYLNVVVNAMKREAELLGIDAPKQQVVSGPGGGPIKVTEIVVRKTVVAEEPVSEEADEE